MTLARGGGDGIAEGLRKRSIADLIQSRQHPRRKVVETERDEGESHIEQAIAETQKRKRAEADAKGATGRGANRRLQITIPEIETRILMLGLEGTTPLIVHRFGFKMREKILRKQEKKATEAKAAKVPFDDFVESLHVLPNAKLPKKKLASGEAWPFLKNTFGFPASGFKLAAVNACSFVDGIAKTIARGAMHVIGGPGDLIPLQYKRLVMREDVVRIGPFGRRVADIRFRGEFEEWKAVVQIRYNARVISAEQIVNLFEHAGFSVGIGEWRPEKGGSHGMFSVARGKK